MMKRSALLGVTLCSLALAGSMLAGCKTTTTVSTSDGTTTTTTTTTTTSEGTTTETTTTENQSSTTLANPVHEGTLEEVAKATGLTLEAPEGATDVTYSYIDMGDDASAMAQTQFTLDGKTFCYRAQPTEVTELVADSDSDSSSDAFQGLEDAVTNAQAFTGVYDSFAVSATTLVSDRTAVIALNEGKVGFVQWLDVVPGIMYSLSMDDGATQDLLLQTAEACFVPTQGEA